MPAREEGMTPYEFMLSESQERMLMVLKPGREDEAKRIFEMVKAVGAAAAATSASGKKGRG